jgi:succinyl-CoA synthetase beta subunit
MKVHEYQGKEVLARYGVAVPRGKVITEAEEARAAAEELGGKVVVKAQIHAGGRGKGGGVKLAGSPDEAVELASQILGMTLVTKQTGPEGKLVRKVQIAEAPLSSGAWRSRRWRPRTRTPSSRPTSTRTWGSTPT